MENFPTNNLNQIRSALFGLAVGDALGVPVEFKNRSSLKQMPVNAMREFGTHNQPAGTWSDDSSLTFCLADALSEGFDLDKIAKKFILWESEGYWTPRGDVFDIGNATYLAITKLKSGIKPELAGGTTEDSNGNGSLMRILPLLFYIKDKPMSERFELTRLVSSITHAHIHSIIACYYYLEFARILLESKDKIAIYETMQKEFTGNLNSLGLEMDALEPFSRLFSDEIFTLNESEIKSGGYVVETLEASIWCLLTTHSYEDAVLKAVNLGKDTDTTAAVTGGLAGLRYGYRQIPKEWLYDLARKDDIDDLCRRLSIKVSPR